MLYGFPLSIVDEDCDVELPDPYPLRSKDPSWKSSEWKAAGKATLLSFKRAMAELTIIVKSALSRLYGTQRKLLGKDQIDNASGSDLQLLISTITELDARLNTWRDHLPRELLLGAISQSQTESPVGGIPESLRSSFPSQTKRLQLFGVQSLSLKLAFENAKILVHRPLLSYKTMAIGHSRNAQPLRSAVRACRDAALQIAEVGSTSEFNEVAGTYAVSFVALHLFTAGVALSILTSLEPLSRESFESKMGLRQLISMHSQLKAKSIVAEQGFEILKRLMTLVMSKETERMLQFEGPTNKQHGCSSDSTQRTSGSIEAVTESTTAMRAGESLVSTYLREKSHDAFMSGSRPEIPEDSAQTARSDLGFCEDPLVTQALLDFEQGKPMRLTLVCIR
ncbi:tall aerial hyphae-4 [Colletotrichum kahawae]|uniref:Tall aerial hyphae-4 n=1 Tax=Colletotrichum kahawae TaxID=34407 RepID=A0AAD9Y0P9_COLKA|nr:tall aerial hyphae-4 [Colletotrichum kahawae]